MSVKEKDRFFDKQQAIEYLVVSDDHGRELHLACGILEHPDPDAYFKPLIEEFAQQEQRITEHEAKRNDTH